MKKERTGEKSRKKQKKAEKNERSLVITYLFSRCSLAITLFVTLCFPFPVTPKTFLVHSQFAQKMRENVGVDSFFQILLVCFQSFFLFFVKQSPFPLHKNIFCTFTNCTKNFVKMLRLIFFSNPWLFPKFVFYHTPCYCLFLLHQKHSLYVHQLLIKFRENVRVDFFFKVVSEVCFCFLSHTLLLSVSVTPKTFFVCSAIAHKIQWAHNAVFRFRYTKIILYNFFPVKTQYDNYLFLIGK